MQLEISNDQAKILVMGLESLYLNPRLDSNIKDDIGPIRKILVNSIQAADAGSNTKKGTGGD